MKNPWSGGRSVWWFSIDIFLFCREQPVTKELAALWTALLQHYSQSCRTPCHHTEWPLEVVPACGSHWQPLDTFLFHRNYTSKPVEWPWTVKPPALWIALLQHYSQSCRPHDSWNCTSQIMEWPETMRLAALWIILLVVAYGFWPQNFGRWQGPMNHHFVENECSFIGGDNWRWWGHSNPTQNSLIDSNIHISIG